MASFGAKLRFVATAGVGFFADGYLNLTIGLVVPILGYLYFQDDKVPSVDSDIMKGGLSLGMVVGQLLFGVLSDVCGRHTVYGKELLLTIFGTLLVVLLPWNGMSAQSVTAWVAIFRVVTGVGIGADYPLSSSLAAEKSPFGSRAIQVLTVFSNIGLGNISASIVFLILLKAFKGAIANNISRLEWVWRLLLGIGIVPALFTLYARLTITETTPYKQYVCDDAAGQKRTFKKQWEEFREYFSHWQHAKVLFATSASWFLYDIAYYGINLNQSIILTRIGYAKGATPWITLYHTAVGNIIIQVAGYLPGFYVGIFLPDRIGRVRQQFWTSIMVCILYAIWAGISTQSAHTPTAGLMVIFALSQFLMTVGPNCTTFLLPAEVFPTRVRGTAHGISAASGKCGAILTAFAFGTVEDAIGLEGVLGLFSGIMLLTALVTLLIPETKNHTLEGIENNGLYRTREAVTDLPTSCITYVNVEAGNGEAKTSFGDDQVKKLSV
ncbi:uncharacterized protein N7518_001062 [Penicillium psychrosexuale]|uniref:uncharacterized protein n=1 Tax=Penicillium psychrosexuale TaxID=1002107 RepID=UPI002544E1BC|nr:uncharacterized protein N7518_001062 [Penicillium psychrosexuale]KAJ5804759.1 hypothetical protein N7518_001062 [Penicillium psychrosexuale]